MRAIITIIITILLATSGLAVTNVQHTVQDDTLIITYDGTPPFLINIRPDNEIGEPGGYVWARTMSKFFSIPATSLGGVGVRYFGVRDADEWSATQQLIRPPEPQCLRPDVCAQGKTTIIIDTPEKPLFDEYAPEYPDSVAVLARVREQYDDPDFLVVFTDTTFGSHSRVVSAPVPGTWSPKYGLDQYALYPSVFDTRNYAVYNTNVKLVVVMPNITLLRSDAPELTPTQILEQQRTVVAHEIGHYWAAYLVNASMNLTEAGDGCNCHYTQCMYWEGATKADLMQSGGLLFTKTGENTFTQTTAAGTHFTPESREFSPLTLYLMGLIPPEEVPPFSTITSPSGNGGCIYDNIGIETKYTIDDFIAAYGPRNPSYPDTQRTFTVKAVILAHQDSHLTQEDFDFAESVMQGLPNTFSELTLGKGTLIIE